MTKSLQTLCKRSRLLVSAARGFRYGRDFYRSSRQLETWKRERTAIIKAYFETHAVRKLQIGTQEHILPGWLNTDLEPVDSRIAFLDAREPFPFEDGALDYVFWEHCIEHISYPKAIAGLRESFRVLKAGGRVRIATPNLHTMIGLCAAPRDEQQERYIRWYIDSYTPEFTSYEPGFVVNNTFRLWGHQFIYDTDTLALALRTAGFSDPHWYAPGESEDENLRGIEGHDLRAGDEMNRFETMIAEAVRPANLGEKG